MSCKFNSELLVAAFWTDHPKGIPPLRFWIFPRRISIPPIFPWGKIPFPPEDIPIPQERNRPRAPIPPGTKCWFAGFIFCFERPNALSDYDLKFIIYLDVGNKSRLDLCMLSILHLDQKPTLFEPNFKY